MNKGTDAEREGHRIIVFIIIHGLMRLLKGMKLCVSGFSECGFISSGTWHEYIKNDTEKNTAGDENIRAEWSEEKISKR